MADEDLAPEFYKGSNFLGRPTSISLTGGDPGAQPTSLDAGVGGIPTGPGAGPGAIPAATPSEGAKSSISIPGSSPSILALLQGGMKIEDIISRLTSGGGFPPGLSAGEAAAQGGEGGVAAGVDATVNAGLGAGQTSSILGESVGSILGTAAPIWAGLTAAVDFLGEGKLPLQDLFMSVFGLGGPSKEWQSFGPRVGGTLKAEDAATTTLARTLATASPDQVPAAIDAWRQAVGEVVQGFGAGAGPLDIPGLAGATASPHEGGASVDWAPTEGGLRALVQAALAGLPLEQRLTAFQQGAQPFLDEQAARQAAIEKQFAESGASQMSSSSIGSE